MIKIREYLSVTNIVIFLSKNIIWTDMVDFASSYTPFCNPQKKRVGE